MRSIETEIVIHASAEETWAILTDFSHYPDWNPFVRSIEGRPQTGEKLKVVIMPPGEKAMTFKPDVVRAEPRRELCWLGHLLIPGLFDGEHHLKIIPRSEGGVRFVQREYFSGLLVPLLWKRLGNNTRQGFVAMNEALKQRAENPRA